MFERTKTGEMVSLRICASAIKRTDAPANPYRTGYGKQIPTPFMVRTIDQKWRRVYVACFSNIGTAYVKHGKQRTIVEFKS